MADSDKKRGIGTAEFWLVVIMLLIMGGLVCAVLLFNISNGAKSQPTADDVLAFRRTILSIIITAFGAWIGAGAAYYFGRENLRQSTDSMLQMRDISGRELLRKTRVSQIPPRKIDWTVKSDVPLQKVLDMLRGDPERYFIPIVDINDKLETVIHEEGVWRFVDAKSKLNIKYDDIEKMRMRDVLEFIHADTKLENRAWGIHVEVKPDNTAETANKMMESKGRHLGIICDDKRRPTHYISADDLRVLLAHSG